MGMYQYSTILTARCLSSGTNAFFRLSMHNFCTNFVLAEHSAMNRNAGCALVLRDGRRRRFGLTGACHLNHLTSPLQQAGVPVDPDLASLFSL